MRYLRIRIGMRFTRWYMKKGYSFCYKDHEPVWDCPWYVRPMTFFFSPVIYFAAHAGENDKQKGEQ